MKSSLNHLQINVNGASQPFYNELMEFLGWSVIFESPEVAGFTSGTGASLWFMTTNGKKPVDYDELGTNHIGIGVAKQSDVDAAVEFLKMKKIPSLFETPRHRKEFAASENETYYQVMFESPDKILFEVVYTGAKE